MVVRSAIVAALAGLACASACTTEAFVPSPVGALDAAPSDAAGPPSDADTAADATSDAPLSAFCKTVAADAGHALCLDFDEGTLTMPGVTQKTTGSGALSIDVALPPRSYPGSLLVGWSAGQISSAVLVKTFPGAKPSTTLEADVRVDQGTRETLILSGITFAATSAVWSVSLALVNGNLAVHVASSTTQPTTLPTSIVAPVAQWFHVRMTLAAVFGASPSGAVALKVDGSQSFAADVTPNIPPPTSTTVALGLGSADAAEPSGTVHYDDVTVDF